jgi:hypothetical protein
MLVCPVLHAYLCFSFILSIALFSILSFALISILSSALFSSRLLFVWLNPFLDLESPLLCYGSYTPPPRWIWGNHPMVMVPPPLVPCDTYFTWHLENGHNSASDLAQQESGGRSKQREELGLEREGGSRQREE